MAKPAKSPRRRLDAAAARALILDAAEKRLALVGPSGIRLQEVAADAGVSHPTVLHHFGSRELLVKAVIQRSLRAVNAALVEAIKASAGDEAQLEAMIDNVAHAMETKGHGRVILWLALEGHVIEESEVRLRDVVDATHALRATRLGAVKGAGSRKETTKDARKRAASHATWEDSARTVVLASLALVGGSVLAPAMLANAGLGGDRRAGIEFRRWLSRVIIAHLEG